MRFPRASGILLHPSSLPGRFGIGDFGPQARAFVDVLADAGQLWWQILPLGPTGYGNSPYQSYSSFAGNSLLISPEGMVEDGWLDPGDWEDYPELPDDAVDFDAVIAAKDALFRRAFRRFRSDRPGFGAFVRENSRWLDDYALFMALKEAPGAPRGTSGSPSSPGGCPRRSRGRAGSWPTRSCTTSSSSTPSPGSGVRSARRAGRGASA